MTETQRAALRIREIQTRLAELGGQSEYSDDERGELDKLRGEFTDLQRRMSALEIADMTETATPDHQEAELLTRGNVGEVFDTVLSHGSASGANAEIQAHYGIDANQIPLAMLRRDEDNDDLMTRAVTPAPANVGQNQAAIIPWVFPDSVAAFLGVDMPTVGVGEAVYPVLTKAPTVGTPAEHAEQADTTGSFSADILSPSRLQAAFSYSREDRARFAGMDSALRMALSEGLSDALDKQIVNGTNGLLNGTNLANHNVSTQTTYALYRNQFAYGRVDGRYASTTGDLRIVMGSGTYAHSASMYRGNNDNQDSLQSLTDATAGIRVSAHVPAVASTKQNAIIRLGMRADMQAPLWEGITIIPDEITKAKAGELVITAVMLHAVKVVREDGFYKQQTQHA